MAEDRAELASEEDPDLLWDDGEEDEIMAELRQSRRDIMAEFDNDLEAYVRHLRTLEEENRNRGVRYVEGPLGKFVSSESTEE